MINVVNYGSGNIKAILNIYKRLRIDCEVANSPRDLNDADKLILPGVGAFDETMQHLESSGMKDALDELVLRKKVPVLGICVGMQMMAADSEEGNKKGLGWIAGSVKKIRNAKLKQKPYTPHMGWNSITPERSNPIFEGVDTSRGFYFLHSYYFSCGQHSDVLAKTEYGEDFACAIHSENIFGFQFHPEKSHSNGVAVLKNFASL